MISGRGTIILLTLVAWIFIATSLTQSADVDLWSSYQGAMVQTIQTRYCQQFLNNHVNFKSVGVSTYNDVKVPLLKDVTSLAGQKGADIQKNVELPPVAMTGGKRFFGHLFPGPHRYPLIAPIHQKLNAVHAEWTEMLRWVQTRHPSGHLGFTPTGAAPGIPLAALYSIKQNQISSDQRFARTRSWVIQDSAAKFLENPEAGKCKGVGCIIKMPWMRNAPAVCPAQATPSIYLEKIENADYWTTSGGEIETLKQNKCHSAASHIGYVLSSALPNTVPLYRISYDNKLFIYTSDPSAPQHFQARSTAYAVTVLGYLYREWPCAVSMGSASVTQVVTEPMMAIWSNKDMCPLHAALAYAPTKTSVAYVPASNGYDGLYAERYKSMLTSLPSANPASRTASANTFAQLQKNAMQCNGITTYPWKVSGTSLTDFMAIARSGKSPVNIGINRSSTTTVVGQAQIAHSNKHHFFGMYGVGSPTQQPIHVQHDHFSMVFQSQGFMGIKVSPGNWFDRNLIRTYAADLTRLGFFGPNGKLPLTPRIIWVAYKPVVTITLKTSEIKKLVTTFSSPSTAAISIGGIRFSSQAITGALGDGDNRVPDTVTLSEPVEVQSESSLEDDEILDSVLDMILDDMETADDADGPMSNIIGLILRLRQLEKDRVTISQQKDTTQSARFQSNSDEATIVGITSENTESVGNAFGW